MKSSAETIDLAEYAQRRAGGNVMSLYAAMGAVGGGQGTAHAVVEAGRHGCLLATVRPEDIGPGLDPDDVIVLS